MSISRQRPGVYYDVTSSGIAYNTASANTVALVGFNDSYAESLRLYEVTRASDAKTIFGENSVIYELIQIALFNGAHKIKVVLSNSATDYSAAFGAIQEESDISVVITDSLASNINTQLMQSVVYSSERSKERIGIASTNTQLADDLVTTLNSERIIEVFQSPLDGDGQALNSCFLAAALAGKLSQINDPSTSLNSTALEGLYGLSQRLTETQIESYLSSGIAVFETVASKPELIRAVTTKTTTDGNRDLTFHDVNTILIIDNIISSLRSYLAKFVSTAKNNQTTRSAIATQSVVLLDSKRRAGLIDSYKTPRVYPDENDSSICVAEIEFTVARGINQIIISAVISL